MPNVLTLQSLKEALNGTAAAFRGITEYQPAGGAGDKVFPPTYEGGKYAVEERRLPGEPEPVQCVLLDSVQSQANRMELALLDAWRAKRMSLPVVTVDFSGNHLEKMLRITSLEAPHRLADALFRDSLLNGKPFRKSEIGKLLDQVDARNATALFELSPTTLVFGMWDSTGPKGGLGAKFARAMVSEIIGLHAVLGKKTSSRIDPAEIRLGAGPLYKAKSTENGIWWTLSEAEAERDKKGPAKLGKDGKPSEANHGNVTPTIADGGVTISKAVQTTVLSLPALRRLRFPLKGSTSLQVDRAAQTALAALGLCAASLAREQGCDLRSRCHLFPTQPFVWELLDKPGESPRAWSLSGEQALDLFDEALQEARGAGLPWMDEELVLTPSDSLVELVRRSQKLATSIVEEGAVAG